ncbi:MAG: MMPL family transporter [Gammaproteobacteria bacterium]|nr:MMPL family transporter [Gammaproteobacteria bacterium]
MNDLIARVYERVILRHPVIVLLLMGLVLVACARGMANFKLDASADALLLENDQALRDFRQMSMRYRTRDFLFIAVVPPGDFLSPENRELVTRLRDDLAQVPQVLDINSMLDVPLVYNVPGSLAEVASNFRTLRQPDVNLERAREELTTSPIYKDLVASADGKVTALQIFLKDHPELPRLRDLRDELLYKRGTEGLTAQQELELERLRPAYEQAKAEAEAEAHKAIEQIREIMARYQGETKLYLGGVPMIADDMVTFIRSDLEVFGAGVFVFLLIMVTLIFREARWVVLPFAACFYALIFMLGLLGHIGWPVTIISSNFIALMLIITMSMNIHLIVRYRELYRDHPDLTHFELVRLTMNEMVRPSFFSAFTTVIAFSSFIICDIKPVIDFGWMMAMGLTVAFVSSFLLFPSILLLSEKRPLKRSEGESYAFTAALGRFTERHGVLVLVLSAVLGIVGVSGMLKLEVENSFVSYFHEDTEIHQGLKLIDEKLGGTTPLDVLLKFPQRAADADLGSMDDDLAAMFEEVNAEADKADSWFTPEKIDRIKAVHDYLDSLPEVGKVLSLASTLRVAEKLNGGREFTAFELNVLYKRIPAPVRQAMIDPYISIENDEARISMRIFDSMPELRRNELLKKINHDLATKFGMQPDEYEVTGLLVLYNNVLQSLFSSQIETLGAVMIGIMLTLMVLFRSFKVALVGIIPNALAACAILGFMGWAGIPLDIMTITIAAITVGIAVDDCIHYLYRYKVELPRLGDPIETMHYCHDNIAKAAYYTTLTVTIGFSILVLSNFIPTILFGVMTAVAMVVALAAALTLMPKLILLMRPFDAPREEDY